VLIRLKELPSGFWVISAELVDVKSTTGFIAKDVRGAMKLNQTNEPGCVYCVAVFEFKGAEEGGDEPITCMSFGLGTWSDLANIRANSTAALLQCTFLDALKMLNKE
jgi:hypothetical protein